MSFHRPGIPFMGGSIHGVFMSNPLVGNGDGVPRLPPSIVPPASAVSRGVVPPRAIVKKAIGPKLRKLLYLVLALLALLIANSAYLTTITAMEWSTGRTYQNFFYLCMFLGHLVLGLLLVVPFIVFCLVHI